MGKTESTRGKMRKVERKVEEGNQKSTFFNELEFWIIIWKLGGQTLTKW